MIKLSRTGWNNVIIFSVMAFILIINITNEQLFSKQSLLDDDQQVRKILPENSVILTLKIDDIVIERIGRTWRIQPVNMPKQAVEQLMMSWHSLEGISIEQPTIAQGMREHAIEVDIAGAENPIVLTLYYTKQAFILFNHQQQVWYRLAEPLYQQLLLHEGGV